jgi:hypothetical protein
MSGLGQKRVLVSSETGAARRQLLHVADVPIVLETLHIADIPVGLEILHGLRRKVGGRRAVHDIELVARAKDDRACRHFPGAHFRECR